MDMLFTNWHFMRWLRLGIGLFFVWQVTQRPDILTGLIALFLLFQAVTNTGCCGAGGCSTTPVKKADASKAGGAEYEEIKGNKK